MIGCSKPITGRLTNTSIHKLCIGGCEDCDLSARLLVASREMYFNADIVESPPPAYSTPHPNYGGGYAHRQCSSSLFRPDFVQPNHQQSRLPQLQHSQVAQNDLVCSQQRGRPLQIYKENQADATHWGFQGLPTSTSGNYSWDINDKQLPKTPLIADFDSWPDGHCQLVYLKTGSDLVKRHSSGWAMRNTNNHNKYILKKSCLGVLLCSSPNCSVTLRPAICDKARKSQEGKQCVRKGCPGRIYLHPCRGNEGYPVTHFWREVGDLVFFQAKGTHGHLRPNAKAVRSKPNRSKPANLSTALATTGQLGRSETIINSTELCFSTHIDTYFGAHLPSCRTEKNVASTSASSCYPFPIGVGVAGGGFDRTSLYSPVAPQIALSVPTTLLRCPTVCSQHCQSESTRTASCGIGPSNGSWSDLSLHLPSSNEEVGDFSPWPYHTPGRTPELCSINNPLQRYRHHHRHLRSLKASSSPLPVHDVHGRPSSINSFFYPLHDNSPLQSSGAISAVTQASPFRSAHNESLKMAETKTEASPHTIHTSYEVLDLPTQVD
ncbi:Transcription factor glial cell missing [Taenia crassiceps]|uniref:Transcription factor glial cell missing n=1 Tax=Taenia crassiceps TaxID=6207 RepID=A0ABR4QUC0_9CEST